jgi:hypothetical protein
LPRSHQEDCHDRRRVERPPDGKTITEYELEQCQRANQTGADARSWRGHPWSGHLCGEVEVVGMPTAASLPSASSPALVLERSSGPGLGVIPASGDIPLR